MIAKLLPNSAYSKKVMTLVTGTSIAQAIPILISPILTRLFTPEEFGILALYLAITAILGVASTGKYELAILLPEKDEDAAQLTWLSIIITTIFSIICLLALLPLGDYITQATGNTSLGIWLYFIPLSVMLTGLYQSIHYWCNRRAQYKSIAFARISRTSTTALLQVGAGLATLKQAGLIIGSIAGQAISCVALAMQTTKHSPLVKPEKSQMMSLAKRYIRFPKFLIIGHSINTGAQQAPMIILPMLFSPVIAGFYILIQRVVRLPMSIIASAIGDVFKEQAAKDFAKTGQCKQIYASTLKKLLILAIPGFVVFALIAPWAFSFIFGDEWAIAGTYAQILTPLFFTQFISSPLSAMYMIAEKQSKDLMLQIALCICAIAPFLAGYLFELDITLVLWLFSLSYAAVYTINLFITYKFASHEKTTA